MTPRRQAQENDVCVAAWRAVRDEPAWWACYARGERRDADYMREVAARFADSPSGVLLKEWVDDVA